MEIRHLRYFLALAEELHFGRAAARAHIDQSPLSRSITQLEQELGVPLFIRSRQGTSLTPAGEALRDHARDILTGVDRARRAVARIGGQPNALRIGLSEGLAQPRLSELFQCWHRKYPDMQLRISELPSLQQQEALLTERIDMGLSFGAAQEEGLIVEPLWADRIMAAIPRAHPLAQTKSLTLASAAASCSLVFCHTRLKPGLRMQIEALLRARGISPILAEPVDTLAGMIVKVGAGCGIAFLDANHARTLQRPDVAIVPLVDSDAWLTIFAITKDGRQDDLSAAMARFVMLGRNMV